VVCDYDYNSKYLAFLKYGAWFGPKVPIVTIPVEIQLLLDFDQSGGELEL